MTTNNAVALTYPRFEQDEAFWDDFFVVTHTWGNASGIESLTMEPEGYFAYSLERMGQDAQTYARTGCWPCVSCEELFPRESLNLNHRCAPCSQQRHQNERRFRERTQGLNLVYPERKPISPTTLTPVPAA